MLKFRCRAIFLGVFLGWPNCLFRFFSRCYRKSQVNFHLVQELSSFLNITVLKHVSQYIILMFMLLKLRHSSIGKAIFVITINTGFWIQWLRTSCTSNWKSSQQSCYVILVFILLWKTLCYAVKHVFKWGFWVLTDEACSNSRVICKGLFSSKILKFSFFSFVLFWSNIDVVLK